MTQKIMEIKMAYKKMVLFDFVDGKIERPNILRIQESSTNVNETNDKSKKLILSLIRKILVISLGISVILFSNPKDGLRDNINLKR